MMDEENVPCLSDVPLTDAKACGRFLSITRVCAWVSLGAHRWRLFAPVLRLRLTHPPFHQEGPDESAGFSTKILPFRWARRTV